MGKTSIALAAFKTLKKIGMSRRMLVVAPLRPCHQVWPKEGHKWLDFSDLKFQVLHGPHKEDGLTARADVFVINPEGLDWLLDVQTFKTGNRTQVKVNLDRLKRMACNILCLDELSKYRHTDTNRFKMLKPALCLFDRRWGLTGSPTSNGLMGLFGQCFVLDQGRTFGPYITHYRTKFFVQGWDGYTWTLKEGADKQIFEACRPLMLRKAAEDYLDLPEMVPDDIMVELPKAAKQVHDQLYNQLITKINDRTVMAATAGSASIKCRQVANGAIYMDEEVKAFVKSSGKREWVGLHEAKTEALLDLIDELQGAPLLVAYDFKHDLERLQAKLGKDVPYIGGGVSTKRAAELEWLWNAGKLPVLLGHPQSIGHGLNLQEAGNHICWYSNTWDYELYDQFNKRVLRQGNKHKHVYIHRIIANVAIDRAMVQALERKQKGQNAFFDAIKSEPV